MIPLDACIANPAVKLILPFFGLILGQFLQRGNDRRVILARNVIVKGFGKADDFTSSCEAISMLLPDIVNPVLPLTRL